MTATIAATDDSPDDVTSDGTSATPTPDPPRTAYTVPPALAPWRDPHPRLGWLVTLVVLAIASVTRFWALGSPPGRNVVPQNGMNFDEIYYATEAQELLRYGYEDNRGYMFIVHPPLGKWLIAFGEYLWDGGNSSQYLTNSLGWRVAPALAGTLGVVMVSRIARRMMRSNVFGGIAGVLMAMEGMSLVLARTAILDIFLQTFLIASFGALVIDRDKMRARLAGLLADGADLTSGAPSLGPRPWRLIAGVMMGMAGAVKWTALSFFVIFWLMSIAWDRAALKSAGLRRPAVPWLRRCVAPSLLGLLALPLFTYLYCWIGWFTGENSWNRYWADSHTPTHIPLLGLHIPFDWSWVPKPLVSLLDYHHDAYTFHEGLDSGHPYKSDPWSWWVLGRPVDFYYNGSQTTCGASTCSREVLLIGTPLLWWAFVPLVIWMAWHWFSTRDWRAGIIWWVIVAGWLVWFQDLKRTMFLFYFAPIVPFLILGLTLAMGVLLGPAITPDGDAHRVLRARRRRMWGIAGISTYLGVVVADFVWMWPLFTGGLLTYAQWHAHMWLPSWV